MINLRLHTAASLTDVFGTWPNLTQGLIGSAIGTGAGVLGALWVARWTVSREGSGERVRQSAEAAGFVLVALDPIPARLRQLQHVEHDGPKGLPDWAEKRWSEASTAVYQEHVLRGHLLPRAIETQFEELWDLLEGVIVYELDEENWPLHITTVPNAELETAAVKTEELLSELTHYRRQIIGAPPR